jgi:hypothetical protein
MTQPLNCLPEGETLKDFIRTVSAIGFELRFCRSVESSYHGSVIETCDPTEAEFATLYVRTSYGEALAIHDVDLSRAGADEVAAVAKEIFMVILNNSHDLSEGGDGTYAQQQLVEAQQ